MHGRVASGKLKQAHGYRERRDNLIRSSTGLDMGGPGGGLRPGLWPLSPAMPDGVGGLEALTEQLGEALNNCAPQAATADGADGNLPRRARVRWHGPDLACAISVQLDQATRHLQHTLGPRQRASALVPYSDLG